MELELSLTNASLLKKAYKHCVGQAYRDSIDHNVVGAGIIPLVSSGVKKLEGLVLDVVQALRSLSAAQGHKQTLAAVIADQIYQRNISTKIWARIHRDKFFDSLSWLDGIRIPLELIDNTDSGWILDEAQVQEDGVTGAGEVFAKQGVDSESNDPDYIKWSTAAKHDLGKDRICEELQWLSKRTKSILEQLLLAEDRGYFTCVEWEGPLPWENHA